MSEREKIEDLITAAICYADDVDGPPYKTLAGAALTALEAAGYVVVPKEPTEAMIEAGCDAREFNGQLQVNTLKTWAAMIAAAPAPNGGE